RPSYLSTRFALLFCYPPSSGLSSFFHWSGAHRDLHSFPTRRSSDLTAACGRRSSASSSSSMPSSRATPPACGRSCPMAGGVALRSEEHTSELQSRENLVCRLLLEKKKKHRQKNTKRQKQTSKAHARP